MGFFLVLYLETSFLVYISILGQLKKNWTFLATILEKRVKYARTRSHIRYTFNLFPIA